MYLDGFCFFQGGKGRKKKLLSLQIFFPKIKKIGDDAWLQYLRLFHPHFVSSIHSLSVSQISKIPSPFSNVVVHSLNPRTKIYVHYTPVVMSIISNFTACSYSEASVSFAGNWSISSMRNSSRFQVPLISSKYFSIRFSQISVLRIYWPVYFLNKIQFENSVDGAIVSYILMYQCFGYLLILNFKF